jgi:sulfonate transport system substrate-binding protein
MKLTTRPAAATAILALVIGGLTGCAKASDDADGPRPTLRVAQLGSATTNKEMLAASGLDQDMPYNIEWSLFDAGPAAIEAVPSGAVDVLLMADTPMIFAQAGGVEAVIVSVSSNLVEGSSQVELVVPGDSPAQGIEDLRGQTIAMPEGTILQYSLIKMLQAAGMTYEDIVPVNLSPPDSATALESGEVQAASSLDPQRARLLAGGARVIANASGLVADNYITIATNAALADPAKVEAIEDFVIRMSRGYAWTRDNRPEWAERYAAVTGLDPETSKTVVERTNLRIRPIDDAVVAEQQEQADVFAELGLLAEPVDVAAEFDSRFNEPVAAYIADGQK